MERIDARRQLWIPHHDIPDLHRAVRKLSRKRLELLEKVHLCCQRLFDHHPESQLETLSSESKMARSGSRDDGDVGPSLTHSVSEISKRRRRDTHTLQQCRRLPFAIHNAHKLGTVKTGECYSVDETDPPGTD